MKRLWLGAFLLLLLGQAACAHAAGDTIRFTQAGAGNLTAILAGTVDPCTGSNHFPIGPSSVVRQGNEYDVSTFFVILDPLPCPAPPQPYEVVAELQNVADGDYSVVWTVGGLSVRATFGIRAGVLLAEPIAMPALGLPALVALALLLALAYPAIRRADFH